MADDDHSLLSASGADGWSVCHGKPAMELDPKNVAQLRVKGIGSVIAGDFLAMTPGKELAKEYDAILMNPPFSRQNDAKHVLHALKFLAPGGLLVAITSSAVTYRESAVMNELRNTVYQRGGDMRALPPGSFAASGTGVHTCLLTIPGSDEEAL